MQLIVEKSDIDGLIRPPPSKSYTHRALISATLSRKSKIISPLLSKDTDATIRGCKLLGARFSSENNCLIVEGTDTISPSGNYLYAENSGTTLRLFTGLLSLSLKEVTIDGDNSLRKRDSSPLIRALKQLGAEITSNSGKPPLKIRGVIKGGEVELEARSSQFLSALLMTLPMCERDSKIHVRELKSRPYIDITEDILKRSGIGFWRDEGYDLYEIPGCQSYHFKGMEIPIDFSSASFMIALGVMAGKVVVEGAVKSLQGDEKIVEIIREMGGKVVWKNDRIISKKSELEGTVVDARDTPDLVPVLSILGAVARGKTEFINAEHLRGKETDRIKTICYNLKKLGIRVEEKKDGLVVWGEDEISGGTIESFGDHRIAMAFSILGIVSSNGIIIRNAECVNVSYPSFYEHLKKLGGKVRYP